MMQKPYGYIYLITHLETGRYYVGQTAMAPYKRWNGHVCDGGKRAKCTIDRAIGKYGKKAFAFEVVAEAADKKQLDSLESAWIIALRSRERGIGFNVRHGGREGCHSEESKAKLRAARSLQVITPEMYQKGADKRRGRVRSEEHRRKLSEAFKGRQLSEETKRRMSEAAKRRCANPVHLAQLIERAKSATAASALVWRGRPHSDESKAKIRSARNIMLSENPEFSKQVAIKRAPAQKRYWESLSPEEVEKRIAPMQKKRWDGVSQEERDRQTALMRARKKSGV